MPAIPRATVHCPPVTIYSIEQSSILLLLATLSLENTSSCVYLTSDSLAIRSATSNAYSTSSVHLEYASILRTTIAPYPFLVRYTGSPDFTIFSISVNLFLKSETGLASRLDRAGRALAVCWRSSLLFQIIPDHVQRDIYHPILLPIIRHGRSDRYRRLVFCAICAKAFRTEILLRLYFYRNAVF